jgi:hypothetical protein
VSAGPTEIDFLRKPRDYRGVGGRRKVITRGSRVFWASGEDTWRP